MLLLMSQHVLSLQMIIKSHSSRTLVKAQRISTGFESFEYILLQKKKAHSAQAQQ